MGGHGSAMQDPSLLVASLGHVATRRQLERFGVTGWQLTSAVRSGTLKRVRNGWYATQQATQAQCVAVRVGGLLAGPTAAASYGLYAGFDRRVHLCVPRNASRLRLKLPASAYAPGEVREPDRSETPVEVHWIPAGRHDPGSDEIWRVSVADCLVQTALWCDRETAIACADTALEARLISPATLLGAFAVAPNIVHFVAEQARFGSQSGLESVVRQRIEKLGLEYRQQVTIPGMGRIDAVVEGCVGIELDGDLWHSGDAYGARDKERDAVAVSKGLPVLRFRFARVFQDWPEVEHQILSAVERFGSSTIQEHASQLRNRRATFS